MSSVDHRSFEFAVVPYIAVVEDVPASVAKAVADDLWDKFVLRPVAELTDDVIAGAVAEQVPTWTFCPECQEVECDDDCRLYARRHDAGLWRPT